jgi:hypothetical protein
VVARRLPVVGGVNVGKAATLSAMGGELDRVRASVWRRFSGAKTAHLSKRQIRDRLMTEGAPAAVGAPQRLWRATVEHTVDKIRAWQQALIATEVRPKIYARAGEDKEERKRLLSLAKAGRWREDPWLSRHCRDAFASKRPRARRSGRIVADNCSYDVQRDEQGRVWLAVMTPTRCPVSIQLAGIAVNPASDGIDRRVSAELATSNHEAMVVSARQFVRSRCKDESADRSTLCVARNSSR